MSNLSGTTFSGTTDGTIKRLEGIAHRLKAENMAMAKANERLQDKLDTAESCIEELEEANARLTIEHHPFGVRDSDIIKQLKIALNEYKDVVNQYRENCNYNCAEALTPPEDKHECVFKPAIDLRTLKGWAECECGKKQLRGAPYYPPEDKTD